MGEKVASENTVFIVFSAKHSSCNKKLHVEKTENLWKIVACFWTWQKGVFVCFFFQIWMLLWFVFCVSGKVAKVLNMFVFPSLGGFVGWIILVYLGLEGLGVFVFLVFVFLLFRFCFFVLFFLYLFCCWMGFGVVWCCSCFVFVFCSSLSFLFVGGLKGQVRWPKGPPHLALNPPCFFLFSFFVFFFAFLSLRFIEKPCFPLKKGIFVYFSVSAFVSL